MSRTIGIVMCLALGAPTGAAAHDGHGERIVVVGTIKHVGAQRIEIETVDQNAMQLKRIWIETDAKTKYVRARKKIDSTDAQLVAGERVTAVITGEHASDGAIRFVTLQLELPRKP